RTRTSVMGYSLYIISATLLRSRHCIEQMRGIRLCDFNIVGLYESRYSASFVFKNQHFLLILYINLN
ncbi:hypothetical protein VU10_07425, partial [Desulfobulbus sp. US1]|nr:hypothetical protein [Desulfobulbus sp. US1]